MKFEAIIAWHERNHPSGVPQCKTSLADAVVEREALSDNPENHRIGYVSILCLGTWVFAELPLFVIIAYLGISWR